MRRKNAESPLAGWIHSASVRAGPSLTEFDLGGSGDDLGSVRWFVFGASDELLAQPALRRLDLAQRNWLCAARLVRFLDDMTLVEHRIVNTAAQVIAERRLGDPVSETLALDALKLYTDEGYHAYFTACASRAVRDAFALGPGEGGPSPKIQALEALVAEAPAQRRDLAWFLVGFAGETMVTKAIVDVMRGTAHSAIQRLLLAHLEDEWAHGRYFAHLFSLVWPRLDAGSRAFAGDWLPRIMAAFHPWDARFHQRILDHVGVDAAACERVLERMGGPARQAERTRHACGNTLQILERCGVFKDEGWRAGFVRAGLIDRDRSW